MNLRRVPILAAGLVGGSSSPGSGTDGVEPVTPVFSVSGAAVPWMPAAPITSPLSTTWFCPGVPASGEPDVGGSIVVANTDDGELAVNVTMVGTEGAPVTEAVTVAPARGPPSTSPPPSRRRTPVPSSKSPAGPGSSSRSRSARCPRAPWPVPWRRARPATSSAWHLAEGYTQDGSREQLVVMNPYPTEATVAIRFATQDGTREPTDLQAESIPPFSVRVYDMADLAARRRTRGGGSIAATRGQITVARAQTYVGDDRRGYAVTLAAPAPRTQWYFVEGESGADITERYSIYNPTDERVEVQPSILGVELGADFIPIDPIEVGRGQVVTFSPADIAGIPEGRHAIVFAAQSLDTGVVVERALGRTIDGIPTTSVTLGAPPRYEDGFVSSTWTMAVGVDQPTEDALVAYNIDALDATITVQAVTPDGIVNVPGLEASPPGQRADHDRSRR